MIDDNDDDDDDVDDDVAPALSASPRARFPRSSLLTSIYDVYMYMYMYMYMYVYMYSVVANV